MDDIRIYDRALSTSTIERIYQLGATTKVNTTIDSNPDLKRGLVGLWTFDGPDIDTSALTEEVRDRSGNGRHGDWQNHSTTTVPGKIGQALDMGALGASERILFDNADGALSPAQLTFSAWFYPRNIDEYGALFSTYDARGSDDSGTPSQEDTKRKPEQEKQPVLNGKVDLPGR
jgi:hypothetical protein